MGISMADANQLKRIEPFNFGDDDPFAELTRIMGFDPRAQNRPAAAEQQQAAVAPAARPAAATPTVQAAPEDDFGFDIDLERELLGDLGQDEPAPARSQPQAAAASFDARPRLPVADDFDREFDAAFAVETVDLDFDLDLADAANDDPLPDVGALRGGRFIQDEPKVADRRSGDGRGSVHDGVVPAAAKESVDEELDFGFDLPMAQVGKDFGGGAAGYARADDDARAVADDVDLSLFDESAFEDAFAFETEKVAAKQGARPVTHAPFAYEAPAAMPARTVHPAPVSAEPSLEDELASLLTNPIAPAELTGSYGPDLEPEAAAEDYSDYAAEAGTADDLADFAADLAAWQPENVGPEGAEVRDTGFGSDDLYYADEAAADDRLQPAAEPEPIDPFAALRAMVDPARTAAPVQSSYRSLATPVAASPSYPSARSSYQYSAATPSYGSPAAEPFLSYEPAAPAASYAAPGVSYAADPADDYAEEAESAYGAPEIETVDVPEKTLAVADDLDLPELAFAVDAAPARGYDDFERELAAAYADSEPMGEASSMDAPDLADLADQSFDSRAIDLGPVAVTTAGAAGWSHASRDTRFDDIDAELDAAANAAFAELGEYDRDDVAGPAAVPLRRADRRSDGSRRGLAIAAVVGGVALIGAIGAFALSSGDGGSDVPVLVRADETPVKVRPENPGGAVVPNQDNKVYQTVTGGVAAPSQETLISSNEEPVDVAAEVDGPLPLNEDDAVAEIMGKIEDRVEPEAEATAAGEEVAVVAPRKVRTMIVKPDGTLAEREEPAEVAIAEPKPGAEASVMEPATAPAATDSTQGGATGQATAEPAATEKPKTKADAAKAKADATKAAEKARTAAIPDTGPLAPSRPADQPVDVVGEVKPEQVAAAGATASAGAWSVQIASQPSEEAAKSTYQDLSRRYANIIGGKGVTIVKAEISGKGTFYRVRVPAGSRSDAQALCEKYKAAGGNCFVSK